MKNPDHAATTPYGQVSRLAALVALVGGSVVLIGWLLDISVFKRVLPGLVTMKVNTALAFVLAGISLWFSTQGNTAGSKTARHAVFSSIAALGVLMIGTLSLLEYLVHVDFGIDQLLIPEASNLAGDIPGRMALVTASNFSLLGTTLLLLRQKQQWLIALVHLLTLAIAIVAASGLVGYAYSTEELYRIKHFYTAMALHTAVIFSVIAIGIVCARPDFPLRRVMASNSAAGIATRQLLLAAALFPFITGWLVMQGYRAGYFGDALALSIFAVTNMTGLGMLVLWNSTLLFKAETLRKQAADELKRNEAQLEAIVARRTEELNKANAALEQEARHDYLTGLSNRRYFMECAASEILRARRFGNDLAVLMIDIDHFKSVNDNYGHQSGDNVLRQLGTLLRQAFREIDIVGRLGGEEFAVILPQSSAEKAVDAAERMRLSLQETPIPVGNGESIVCTASVGVAILQPGEENIDQPLYRADQALYAAKRSGRNRVMTS